MTDKHTIGDGPIEDQYREQMKEIGRMLDAYFNGEELPGIPAGQKHTGFILMVFPFDEVRGEGRCNYLSNAMREDVVIMLKEQLRRFEGQPEVSGRA